MAKRRSSPATQLDFSCSLCGKTFESSKQSTRHIRYCRTKAKDVVSTRRKSCAACIKAKTRCDMATAGCSRCFRSSIHCHYESSKNTSSFEVPRITIKDVEPLDENIASQNDVPAPSSSTWTDLLSSPGGTNVDDIVFLDEMLDLVSSDSLAGNFGHNNFPGPQIEHFKDRVLFGSFYVVSHLDSYVPFDVSTIVQKQHPKAGPYGSAVARAYCITILRSYPGMMCASDEGLPPFIHSKMKTPGYLNNGLAPLSDPLAICSSIMQMYKARSPGNLHFIWKTIEMEVMRIGDEYKSYDTSKTLGALQALVIYALLGLLNDTSEFQDGGFLLRMLNIKKRIVDKHWPIGWMSNEIRLDHIPDWKEWVLAESRRRTCIVLIFIIHIFAIEHAPGVPRCGGFADLPLPCSRKLWQASDKVMWEAEYRKQCMKDDGFSGGVRRLPTYRDLLPDFQDGSSSGMGHLSEWFSGMDDLGTLVMMAVSTL